MYSCVCVCVEDVCPCILYRCWAIRVWVWRSDIPLEELSVSPFLSCYNWLFLVLCNILPFSLSLSLPFSLPQLKAYQEDFEAERRDRERLNEEKQSAALRFEAEITSLKLQLDRWRNELVHYTTESTRLAQQLRLKNQYEEEQFKKHLESQVGWCQSCSDKTIIQ